MTLQDQFNSLRNQIIVQNHENWLPISKGNIDIFEKFLLKLLENKNIPQPNLFPTEDGNIVAEWIDENISKWAVSLELTNASNGSQDFEIPIAEYIDENFPEYLLHAIHPEVLECIFERYYIDEEYAYTIHGNARSSRWITFSPAEDRENLTNKLKSFWK